MNTKAGRVARILGIGFDGADGHVRLTQGDHFRVYAGSRASHDAMSALCLRLERRLKERGQTLADLTESEFLRLVSELS